jgi:hypothetical protein
LEEDATPADNRVVDNPWRGAQAYHFFLLAQRQLIDGHTEDAVRTGRWAGLSEREAVPVEASATPAGLRCEPVYILRRGRWIGVQIKE